MNPHIDNVADLITPEIRTAYERDGAVLIKGAFGMKWIEMLREGHARVRDNPSSPVRVQRSDDGDGVTLTAQFCFRNEPEMRKFTYESPIAAIAAVPTNSVDSSTRRTNRGDLDAPRSRSHRAVNAMAATRSGMLPRFCDIRCSHSEAPKFSRT